jgi:hypothetical protein
MIINRQYEKSANTEKLPIQQFRCFKREFQMSKSYQYVSKCSCCEDRFTRVSVPFMHVAHCSALGENARKAIAQQGFKGSLSLQCAGETITNFFYQYAGSSELAKSVLLHKSLSGIAKDYFNDLSDEGVDWTYYPIDL